MNPAKDPLLPYVRGSVPVPRPSEPLPCPFCQGEARIHVHHDYWQVECWSDGCQTAGPVSTDSEADAIAKWNARRSSSSPSVPTATQEQRATDYRDFETFGDLPESVRIAVRAHTFAQPAGGELWDNMTSREQRNWMVQLYDKANRDASSEEAANSDTERLNWLERQIPTASSGGYRLKSWREAADAPRYYLVGDSAIIEDEHLSLRAAIDAARVQGEN